MLPDVERTLEDALSITDAMGLRVLPVGAWARDLCLPEDARGQPRQTNDLQLDDLPVWFLGRNLKAGFSDDVVRAFTEALGVLAERSLWHRGLLFHQLAKVDERLRRADRLIRVLAQSCASG